MRAAAAAVVILGACSLQEASGAHFRSGGLRQIPGAKLHDLAGVDDAFIPMHRVGETAAEYDRYAAREKKIEDHRRDAQLSRNAVQQTKAFRSMKNEDAKQEAFDRIKKKQQLLVKSAEKEAFENLDADEKEEREEEIQEDERVAKIKDQTEQETENIKEDVQYNRLPKDFEALDHAKAVDDEEVQEHLRSKTKGKVMDARLPDTPDEPERAPRFEDAMRGDDKELSDMFFEEGRPDKAKEDSKLEKYIPGFQ